ncbi:hypothetical protein [Streptomyces varsoviensis]|uniref:hypothetical protein n=1 Tax=Streptomyces varsoviensis TaxID=67373 RepID=UPI0004CA3FBB|nr:hypothetical protein [Streptomyces varsoviensis]
MSADTAMPVRAPEPQPADGARMTRRSERVREALRRAAPALGLYAAARLTGLLTMAAWAWWIGRHPRTTLGLAWDGTWYTGIARNGYGQVHPGAGWAGLHFSDVAFFPLFPGLMRGVATVLPIGLINSGLLVAWASSAAAAWGLYAVGERLHGRRAGTLLVLLWGLLPHAIIETMSYTEPLMTALAAWSLYALLTGRWVWAGGLSLLAGLCRPNGIAVAAAVCCAAAVVLWKDRRARRNWRVWTGAALSPVGWLGYVAWVGAREGSPLGYFAVQRGWGSRFDFGYDAFMFIRHLVIGLSRLGYYVTFALIVAALLALVFLALDRPPLPVFVYTLVLVVIALGGSKYFASKPRFLLPAFPLLFPAALAMARARQRTVVVTAGALAGLSFGYGAYLLLVAPMPM